MIENPCNRCIDDKLRCNSEGCCDNYDDYEFQQNIINELCAVIETYYDATQKDQKYLTDIISNVICCPKCHGEGEYFGENYGVCCCSECGGDGYMIKDNGLEDK